MVPADARDRSPQEMTAPVRQALAAVPGISVTVGAGSGIGGGGAPVRIDLSGDSFAVLGRLSDELVRRLKTIDGLADVASSLDDAQPVIGIRLNREAASDLGVTLAEVGDTIEPMLGGRNVGDWTAPDGRNYAVVIRLAREVRNNPATLGALPVAQSQGEGMIRLDQVAEVTESFGPAEISRRNQARTVTVSANLAGVTLSAVLPEVRAAIGALDAPPGYRVSTGGEAEDLADSFASAVSALVMAVIFIYLVLASQFGSFLQPVAIMASLPLALIGVLLGLLAGGSTLNMFSIIGFIMLMGLVTKNAILLVDNANQRRREGVNLWDALVMAGETRFRPIIMTTLAMIFGMLPLALNLHEGSGQNAPMAHAVIGGLISSTILTLVVVPVALTYLDAFGRRVARFFPPPPDHGEGRPHDPAA
jgi:HAE1 family hydrophobic/amphiphilic exporter-1